MTRRQRKAGNAGTEADFDGAAAPPRPARPKRRDAAVKTPPAADAGDDLIPAPGAEKSIKLLILEGSDDDAGQIGQALRAGGVSFTARHAATWIAFIRALREFEPDLVFSAYRLPDFNGLSAVKFVRLHSASLPVIVTGEAMNRAAVAAVMQAGASQFVPKDRLTQLVPAVRQAMAEAEAIKAGSLAAGASKRGEERLQTLVNAAAPLFWIADAEGNIVEDMPGWRTFTGQTFEQARGTGWWNAVHPGDRKQVKAAWREALHHGRLYEANYRIRRADGEYPHFTVRAVPVRNADGAIREWLGICFDVSEQRRQECQFAETQARMVEALRAQAVRDPLTGLYNRYYLQETMPRECRQAQRRRTPFSVAMLDIDNFKQFNDLHGHQAGDKVLKELGKLLLVTVRTSDIVCRYGGEEFLLVLFDAELPVALTSLNRICQEIKHRRIVYRGQVLPSVTLSAGIAQFPAHGTSTSDLLHAADQALYAAKGQGRDRIIISTCIPGDTRRRG
jgi:diguanylate cyclase (GGDEF)-like protein/PAS domain S-box-containing protein